MNAVEVRDGQRVHRAARERVAEERQVEPAAAEAALPADVVVVRLGDVLQRVHLGGERPCAVAGGVAPQDAEALDLAVPAVEEREGVLRRAGAPGGVRVEAAPLVQQHTLRALEDQLGLAREDPREVFGVHDDPRGEQRAERVEPGCVRARGQQRLSLGHPARIAARAVELRGAPVAQLGEATRETRAVSQIAHAEGQARRLEGRPHRLADAHPGRAVGRVAARDLSQPAERLVMGRGHEGALVDAQAGPRVGHALRGEPRLLHHEGGRVHDDV
ncbi:MAG: hypothetical protein SangKO_071150 [Sandaracinaceae bacterium]